MTLQMLHTGLCLALLWTCFCRITRTDETTLAIVRAVLAAMAAAALAGALSPWLWGGESSWPEVFVIALALGFQLATAHEWRLGVPGYFRNTQGEAT